MGQQLKPNIEFPKIDWTEFKKDINNVSIYKSPSGLLAKRRQLTQDKKLQPEQQLKIYHQRSCTALPLVKVFSAQVQQEKKNFCSTTQKILLYQEYIPNRLQKIKPFSLTEPQTFYVLQQCLKGFHQIFQKFGYFQIKSDLIGFNTQGQVKCWLNKDFANNRIENGYNAVLGGSQFINGNIDARLKETLQKAMVCDLWNTIKKKSNIQNRDLFYRLSGFQNTTFENAKKLIQALNSKYHFKLPQYLVFENCLQFKNNINRQYNYGRVYESENPKLKVVEIMQNQVLKSGTFNFQPEQNKDVNFKDFESYREYIENMNRKTQNNCRVSLSFNIKSPQKVINEINSPRRMLKIVDKTFDINLCSNLRSPSNKTISQTEPSQKKIFSDENIFLPLNTIQKQTSIFIPNAVSQRYILTEMQQNLPSSRVNTQSKEIKSPVNKKIFSPYESREHIFIQDYQPVFRRTSSRFISPPPPVFGLVRKPSITVLDSNQCRIPQLMKVNTN